MTAISATGQGNWAREREREGWSPFLFAATFFRTSWQGTHGQSAGLGVRPVEEEEEEEEERERKREGKTRKTTGEE